MQIFDGSFVACDASCLTCATSATQCTGCAPGLHLESMTCLGLFCNLYSIEAYSKTNCLIILFTVSILYKYIRRRHIKTACTLHYSLMFVTMYYSGLFLFLLMVKVINKLKNIYCYITNAFSYSGSIYYN